jgi:hypothetical protein
VTSGAPDTYSDDYVPVAQRLKIFKEQYPTGCLRPLDPARPFQIVQIGQQTYVAVVMAAFRTPDDIAPGVGMAWQPLPGATEYTFNAELMNAETAAVGRALVHVLAAGARASSEEVRLTQENRVTQEIPRPASRAEVRAKMAAAPGPEEAERARQIDERLAQDPLIQQISAAHQATDPEGNGSLADAAAKAAAARKASLAEQAGPESSDKEAQEQIWESAMQILDDPTVTYQQLRDTWGMLNGSGLISRWIPSRDSTPPDMVRADGMASAGAVITGMAKVLAPQ